MKKVTLFLDKSVQGKFHEWTEAYKSALAFYAEFIHYVTNPRDSSLAGDIMQCMAEGGFPGHLKNLESTIRQIKDAHRVEACITLRYHGSLALEIRAYDSGKKKPYCTASFYFAQVDGSQASSGSSQVARESC